ncbi:collagen alpha-1(I) chain-like [Phoca vitulina]|uniref:collagen alpha-1(I) chain-like n=1 Tax=Phoca vitulina TaxID=9720 RepID=UPI001395FD07|nr:collagen alpha-1(I) chain-like [Phoca vitulina]
MVFISRILSRNKTHYEVTGGCACGSPTWGHTRSVPRAAGDSAPRSVQRTPLGRRGWLGGVQGHPGDPRLETRGDPGPGASSGTTATFGHHTVPSTSSQSKQAWVWRAKNRAGWSGLLERPASRAAVCDAEGPRPTLRQPAGSREAAFGAPGAPGQQGLGDDQGSSGWSAHRRAAEIPAEHSSPSSQKELREPEGGDVSFRLLTKAQVCHILTSRRPLKKPSLLLPAARARAAWAQPAHPLCPLLRLSLRLQRGDPKGVPPQPSNPHGPRPPQRGSAPAFRSRQGSPRCSHGEPLWAGRPMAPHRAQGADGEMDRGSDHGAQAAHRPLADPAGPSTRALWLQVDRDTKDKNTEDPAKPLRRPQGQEGGEEKG